MSQRQPFLVNGADVNGLALSIKRKSWLGMCVRRKTVSTNVGEQEARAARLSDASSFESVERLMHAIHVRSS